MEETNEPYAIAKIAGIKMCEAYRDQYGCNFISVMPTNLYGPNDNFDLKNSHVLPAMIRKMHLGKCLENGDFDAIREDLDKRTTERKNEGTTTQWSDDKIKSYLEENGIVESLPRQSVNRSIGQSKTRSVVLSLWGTGSPKREFLYVEDMAEACVYLMLNYNEKQFLNIGCGEDISIKDLALLVKNIVGFKGELKFDSSKPDGTPRKLLDVSKLFATGWKPKVGLEEGIDLVYKRVFKN